MTTQESIRLLIVGVPILACTSIGNASFTTYTNFDAWKSAAGNTYTTLDFVFPQPVLLTTQYIGLGVLFPEGEEVAHTLPASYPLDGWGVKGAPLADNDIHIQFATPQKWIAAHYPGKVSYQLISNGAVIFTSLPFSAPGANDFYGVVSELEFDEVKLINPSGELYVDNVYFGIPTPGALAVLGLGIVSPRRRARRA
jgi:hypothetical protein